MMRPVLAACAMSTMVLALANPAHAQSDDDGAEAGSAPGVTAAVPATVPATVPAIDVADLPPLPRTELDERVTSVTEVAATEAEEGVVVGAAKREQSLGDVASAVTVISADRLRRFGYRTVAEALNGVAGMFIVDDRMAARLGIRGLQILGDFNTRVLVLIDGATINEPWNQFAGIAFDMPLSIDEVARIEVIRGPVSSVYGTNAFFGIINIVTRSADRSPGAYARVSGSQFGENNLVAGFAAGTVNRQIRGTFAGMMRTGETVRIPEFAMTEEDPATSADGSQGYSGSLVASYDGAFLQLRAYRHARELTGAPYDTVAGDSRNVNKDNHFMLEGGYSRDLGERLTVSLRGYFNRYRFEDYLVYEPGDDNFRDIGDSLWLGAEARARWAILSGNRLGITAGVETIYTETSSESFYEDTRADGAKVDTPYDTEAVYAELDAAPLSWLGLVAGVRYDRNSILPDNLSPRAALFLHQGERYGAKLLYAEGFRNPSAYEGFFDDDLDFEANPAIGPETIRSYEAVLWGRPVAGLDVRLSGFHWQFEDLIELVEVDLGMDMSVLQFQNQTSGTTTGVEAEVSYRNTRGWYGFAGVGFAEVLVDSGDAEVRAPNAPRWTASLGVSTPAVARLAHVSTELLFVDARKTRAELVEAEPHLGWNAAVHVPSVTGVRGIRGFDFTFGVRNLLGIREQIPAQADFDRGEGAVVVPLIPGEGREIYARLGYSY